MSQFLSGPYAWSLGVVGHTPDPTTVLGVVEDAPTFRFSRESDPITGDNLGAAIQGVVDRVGNLFIDMIFQEMDLITVSKAWWPYNDVLGVIADSLTGGLGVGRLTPTFELRADKIIPLRSPVLQTHLNLMRFQNAQLAPGFDITQLLGSRLRNVPISFLCSPFLDANSNTVYWTQV